MFSNINIYSCSPTTVFSDIDDVIYNEIIEEIDEITILRYEIVLRDIRIRYLEKNLQEFEFSHNMWKAISGALFSDKLSLCIKK